MALKDLKSDLSKFRMPTKDPLVNKQRESIKKKQNQTPLSSMLKSKPNLETSDKTPTKQGTKVNKFDNSSNFLGETDPSAFDNSTRFLGETCPTDFTFNPNHSSTAKTPGEVNYFSDIHATGFTSNFNDVDATKFVGINPSNTIFDTTTSAYGNFGNSYTGLGFSAGYEAYKPVGSFTGDTPRYQPDIKYSTNSFKELSIPSNGILIGQDGTGFLHHQWFSRASYAMMNGVMFRPGYGIFKSNLALMAPKYKGLNPGDTDHYTTDTHIPQLKQIDRGIFHLQDGTGFLDIYWGYQVLSSTTGNPDQSTTFRPGYGSYKTLTNAPLLGSIYKGLNVGDTDHYTTDTHIPELKQLNRGIFNLQDGTGFLDTYWANLVSSYTIINPDQSTTFRPGYGSYTFNNTPLLGSIYKGLNTGDTDHYTTDAHIPELKKLDRGIFHLQTDPVNGLPFNRQHWATHAFSGFYSGMTRVRPGYASLKFTITDSLVGSAYTGLNPSDDGWYTTEESRLSLKPKLKQVGRGIQNLQEPSFIQDLYNRDINLAKFDFPEWNFKFRPGYQNFKSSDYIAEVSPRFNYTDTYTTDGYSTVPELTSDSIQTLHQKANSKSFLDKMYDKYNLKDDAYNTGFDIPLLKHPLILRGIQRPGGEPDNFGIAGVTFDDGFIRGGAITSTVRAGIDVARIAKWMASPKGIVWAGRQFLSQLGNKYSRIWTPINLLMAVGGQHIGLKPMRGGLIPLRDARSLYFPNKILDKEGNFKNLRDKLKEIYTGVEMKATGVSPAKGKGIKNLPFESQTYFGGPMSFYGIGVTRTKRHEDTFAAAFDTSDNSANYEAGTPYTTLETAPPVYNLAHVGVGTQGVRMTSTPSGAPPREKSSKKPYQQKYNPFDKNQNKKAFSTSIFENTYQNDVGIITDDNRPTFGLAGIQDKFKVVPKDKNASGVSDEFGKQKINPFKPDDNDGTSPDETTKVYSPSDSRNKKAKGKDDVSVPSHIFDKMKFGLAGESEDRTDDKGYNKVDEHNPSKYPYSWSESDIVTDIKNQPINPFKTDDDEKVYSPRDAVYPGSSGKKDGVSVPTDIDERSAFGLTTDSVARTTSDGTYKVDETNPDIKKDIQNQKLNPFKTDDVYKVYSPAHSKHKVATHKDDVSVPTDVYELASFGLGGTQHIIEDIDGVKTDNHGNSLSMKSATVPGSMYPSPIEAYETIAYGKIPNTRLTPGIVTHDFRTLLSATNENKLIADNRADNHHKRTEFGHPGNVGADKEKWWLTGAAAISAEGTVTRHDKINANPISSTAPLNDLIHLWFKNDGEYIQFRGVVSSIQETFSPGWSPVKYSGRADSGYKYDSFDRSLSFNFQVTATSRIEMKNIWLKLEHLSTLTMPSYYTDGNGYKGNLIEFRLGSLYNDKLAFFKSFSYTMKTDVPWEISPLGSNKSIGELPRSIDVSVGLQILDGVKQHAGAKIYDFAELRTNG